ncbi:MAG: hypothetical protein ACRC8M_01810 [Cetobacterium sp.]|uniref:hypothetical protein n=1 Tax=Cetobacterium sp. TaxID=2071632 RepID=UPI003F404BF0
MMNKKQILFMYMIYGILSYSVYQNTNSKKLLSKESLAIKGKVIEFKGIDEILVENEVVKTIEEVVILEDKNEVHLTFNHEDVELKVEENQYLNIDIVQEIDSSKFAMSFEKKTDYVESDSWKLVTITAIYR